MKNILLITNIYPNNDPEYGGTEVCHYFTKEWIEMGYNVRVIHFDSLFPRPFYWVGKWFNSALQARTGCVIYTKTPRKPTSYVVDNVPVTFIPLKKLIPHQQFSESVMNKAFDYAISSLEKDGFAPDVVAGHFVLPQLQFLHMFKEKYPNAKTAMILHSAGESIPSYYKEKGELYMKSIDVWGFRSMAFKNQFEEQYGKKEYEFLCYSGIPAKYLDCNKKTYTEPVKKFVFVGSLYELKRVEDTVRALNIAFPEKNFEFHIVGSGAEESNLKNLVSQLGLEEQVTFHGQQKRDNAQKIIEGCDCFVMVSAHEAFGLVYVESMAKGLVTIATKGQGIDGVIKHGENGFLCESHSPEKLAELLKHISSMSNEELNEMSTKAIATANELTNRKVAESYINAII